VKPALLHNKQHYNNIQYCGVIVYGCLKDSVIELLLLLVFVLLFYLIDFDRFICFYLPVSLSHPATMFQ